MCGPGAQVPLTGADTLADPGTQKCLDIRTQVTMTLGHAVPRVSHLCLKMGQGRLSGPLQDAYLLVEIRGR